MVFFYLKKIKRGGKKKNQESGAVRGTGAGGREGLVWGGSARRLWGSVGALQGLAPTPGLSRARPGSPPSARGVGVNLGQVNLIPGLRIAL